MTFYRSAASSVASFDYQPARYGADTHSLLPSVTEVEYVTNESPVQRRRNENESPVSRNRNQNESPVSRNRNQNESPVSRSRNQTPKGERVPPEGASADSPKPFVQRIEIGSGPSEKRSEKSSNPPRFKSKSSAAIDEVKDLLYPVENANGEPDEFSNLRKLISEGRISGLGDKPPSFVPPTPPNAKRVPVGSRKDDHRSAIEKKPSRTSADRPRKAREAPKPPTSQNSPSTSKTGSNPQTEPVKTGFAHQPEPVNPEVKLLTSRHRESLEDLTQMETRRRRNSNNEVKRSSSNHGVRPSGENF